MNKISCAIIDDNIIDAEYLKTFVVQYDFLDLRFTFSNPLEAHEHIKSQNIELLFLDIDMPLISGMDYLKQMENAPICIFVTAHSEYAWEGFEAKAFDYILKPLKPQRFEATMVRLKEYKALQDRADLYDTLIEDNTITIKEGNIKHVININEILYIEAIKDYSKVVTKTKKIMTLSKLKHFLDKLPKNQFTRVHKSYAIAVSKIDRTDSNDIYIQDIPIPIGRTFKNDIKFLL
jgi:DNA-binding LytR/AlgR family response regulator